MKIKEVLLVAIVAVFSLAVAEVAMRLVDGYDLLAWNLGARPNSLNTTKRNAAIDYLDTIPLAEQVDRRWFTMDPPPFPPQEVDPQLQALMDAVRGKPPFSCAKVTCEWNKVFLQETACKGGAQEKYFSQFPPESAYFEPADGSPYPRYRYPRNVVTPLLLHTNSFGWRGPDLDLNKPANTIRIVFLGSSTTVNSHGYPFSYPEMVGNWLNLWAKAQKNGITFEVINAAREGIASSDIAAVFRQEVLPVEPDLVLYYEGSNEFNLTGVIPAGARKEGIGKWASGAWENGLLKHFSLARRLEELFRDEDQQDWLSEPAKPDFPYALGPDVQLQSPDPNLKDLPLNLNTILGNLKDIHKNADSIGCDMALLSFVWLPYEGMKLHPVIHKGIYDYINLYWPARYNDFKVFSDYQNGIFKKFADQSGIHFIDVAKEMPRDPDLFNDGIHNSYDGVRLRAWIVLQGLLPIIREKIAAGDLPRPDLVHLDRHPGLNPPVHGDFPGCN